MEHLVLTTVAVLGAFWGLLGRTLHLQVLDFFLHGPTRPILQVTSPASPCFVRGIHFERSRCWAGNGWGKQHGKYCLVVGPKATMTGHLLSPPPTCLTLTVLQEVTTVAGGALVVSLGNGGTAVHHRWTPVDTTGWNPRSGEEKSHYLN